PEQREYYDIRRKVRRFEEDTLKRESSGGNFVQQPKYADVKEAFRRLDEEGAAEAVKRYRKEHPTEDDIRKLRASISNGRPINLNRDDTAKFLASWSPEDRDKARRIQQKYEAMMYRLIRTGSARPTSQPRPPQIPQPPQPPRPPSR